MPTSQCAQWKDLMYRVHQEVNAIGLASDASAYEQRDTMLGLLDLAEVNSPIYKYRRLLGEGVPQSDMQLAIIQTSSKPTPHGVLVMCGKYVLDSSFETPVTFAVFRALFDYNLKRICSANGWTNWT